VTHKDVGNAGFAGAKTCPCAAGKSDEIRPSLIIRLKIEQVLFTPDASAETRETPVCGDHTVTRNDDRNMIFSIGTGDGTDGFCIPDF
jgi:hypothetical protein